MLALCNEASPREPETLPEFAYRMLSTTGEAGLGGGRQTCCFLVLSHWIKTCWCHGCPCCAERQGRLTSKKTLFAIHRVCSLQSLHQLPQNAVNRIREARKFLGPVLAG